MTEATETARVEQVDPKRRMALEIAKASHELGPIAWGAALAAAHAAIEATTEAAAKLARTQADQWKSEGIPIAAVALRSFARDLTNSDLEPRHDR